MTTGLCRKSNVAGKYIRWFLYALGLAYLALLPQFYELTNAETRFSVKWSWEYYLSIELSVLILTLIYWCMFGLVRFLVSLTGKRSEQLFHWLVNVAICCLFLRCVTSIMIRSNPDGILSGWLGGNRTILLYICIPIGWYLFGRKRFSAHMRGIAWLGVIAWITFSMWSLTYPRYAVQKELTPISIVDGKPFCGKNNVFVLIFDEWSYGRTYPDGVLRRDLPHLAEFSRTADIYSNFYSAGPVTMVSILRFLFQRNSSFLDLSYQELIALLQQNRYPGGDSIFSGENTHYTAIFGTHLDYRFLVPSVNYASYVPFIDTFMSVPDRIYDLLSTQISFLKKFGIDTSRYIHIGRDGGIERLQKLEQRTYELAARTQDVAVFAVCHLPIPHYPYVWDTMGPVSRHANRTPIEAYEGNLRYMDSVLGRFIEALKMAGTWDNTMLVVTSDHAWRFDPEKLPYNFAQEDTITESSLKHVPFLVKYPNQRTSRMINTPFFATQTYDILQQGLRE